MARNTSASGSGSYYTPSDIGEAYQRLTSLMDAGASASSANGNMFVSGSNNVFTGNEQKQNDENKNQWFNSALQQQQDNVPYKDVTAMQKNLLRLYDASEHMADPFGFNETETAKKFQAVHNVGEGAEAVGTFLTHPVQATRFLASIPSQVASGAADAWVKATEAISGDPLTEGIRQEDGTYKIPDYKLNTGQRAATAADAALDVMGSMVGGEKTLLRGAGAAAGAIRNGVSGSVRQTTGNAVTNALRKADDVIADNVNRRVRDAVQNSGDTGERVVNALSSRPAHVLMDSAQEGVEEASQSALQAARGDYENRNVVENIKNTDEWVPGAIGEGMLGAIGGAAANIGGNVLSYGAEVANRETAFRDEVNQTRQQGQQGQNANTAPGGQNTGQNTPFYQGFDVNDVVEGLNGEKIFDAVAEDDLDSADKLATGPGRDNIVSMNSVPTTIAVKGVALNAAQPSTQELNGGVGNNEHSKSIIPTTRRQQGLGINNWSRNYYQMHEFGTTYRTLAQMCIGSNRESMEIMADTFGVTLQDLNEAVYLYRSGQDRTKFWGIVDDALDKSGGKGLRFEMWKEPTTDNANMITLYLKDVREGNQSLYMNPLIAAMLGADFDGDNYKITAAYNNEKYNRDAKSWIDVAFDRSRRSTNIESKQAFIPGRIPDSTYNQVLRILRDLNAPYPLSQQNQAIDTFNRFFMDYNRTTDNDAKMELLSSYLTSLYNQINELGPDSNGLTPDAESLTSAIFLTLQNQDEVIRAVETAALRFRERALDQNTEIGKKLNEIVTQEDSNANRLDRDVNREKQDINHADLRNINQLLYDLGTNPWIIGGGSDNSIFRKFVELLQSNVKEAHEAQSNATVLTKLAEALSWAAECFSMDGTPSHSLTTIFAGQVRAMSLAVYQQKHPDNDFSLSFSSKQAFDDFLENEFLDCWNTLAEHYEEAISYRNTKGELTPDLEQMQIFKISKDDKPKLIRAFMTVYGNSPITDVFNISEEERQRWGFITLEDFITEKSNTIEVLYTMENNEVDKIVSELVKCQSSRDALLAAKTESIIEDIAEENGKDLNWGMRPEEDIAAFGTKYKICNAVARLVSGRVARIAGWFNMSMAQNTRFWDNISSQDKNDVANGILGMALEGKYKGIAEAIDNYRNAIQNANPAPDTNVQNVPEVEEALADLHGHLDCMLRVSTLDTVIVLEIERAIADRRIEDAAWNQQSLLYRLGNQCESFEHKLAILEQQDISKEDVFVCMVTSTDSTLSIDSANKRLDRVSYSVQSLATTSKMALQNDIREAFEAAKNSKVNDRQTMFQRLRDLDDQMGLTVHDSMITDACWSVKAFNNDRMEKSKAEAALQRYFSAIRWVDSGLSPLPFQEDISGASMCRIHEAQFWNSPVAVKHVLFNDCSYELYNDTGRPYTMNREYLVREIMGVEDYRGGELSDTQLEQGLLNCPQLANYIVPTILVGSDFNGENTVKAKAVDSFSSVIKDALYEADPEIAGPSVNENSWVRKNYSIRDEVQARKNKLRREMQYAMIGDGRLLAAIWQCSDHLQDINDRDKFQKAVLETLYSEIDAQIAAVFTQLSTTQFATDLRNTQQNRRSELWEQEWLDPIASAFTDLQEIFGQNEYDTLLENQLEQIRGNREASDTALLLFQLMSIYGNYQTPEEEAGTNQGNSQGRGKKKKKKQKKQEKQERRRLEESVRRREESARRWEAVTNAQILPALVGEENAARLQVFLNGDNLNRSVETLIDTMLYAMAIRRTYFVRNVDQAVRPLTDTQRNMLNDIRADFLDNTPTPLSTEATTILQFFDRVLDEEIGLFSVTDGLSTQWFTFLSDLAQQTLGINLGVTLTPNMNYTVYQYLDEIRDRNREVGAAFVGENELINFIATYGPTRTFNDIIQGNNDDGETLQNIIRQNDYEYLSSVITRLSGDVRKPLNPQAFPAIQSLERFRNETTERLSICPRANEYNEMQADILALESSEEGRDFLERASFRPSHALEDPVASSAALIIQDDAGAALVPTMVGINGMEQTRHIPIGWLNTSQQVLSPDTECDAEPEEYGAISNDGEWATFCDTWNSHTVLVRADIVTVVTMADEHSSFSPPRKQVETINNMPYYRVPVNGTFRERYRDEIIRANDDDAILVWPKYNCSCPGCAKHGLTSDFNADMVDEADGIGSRRLWSSITQITEALNVFSMEAMLLKYKKRFRELSDVNKGVMWASELLRNRDALANFNNRTYRGGIGDGDLQALQNSFITYREELAEHWQNEFDRDECSSLNWRRQANLPSHQAIELTLLMTPAIQVDYIDPATGELRGFYADVSCLLDANTGADFQTALATHFNYSWPDLNFDITGVQQIRPACLTLDQIASKIDYGLYQRRQISTLYGGQDWWERYRNQPEYSYQRFISRQAWESFRDWSSWRYTANGVYDDAIYPTNNGNSINHRRVGAARHLNSVAVGTYQNTKLDGETTSVQKWYEEELTHRETAFRIEKKRKKCRSQEATTLKKDDLEVLETATDSLIGSDNNGILIVTSRISDNYINTKNRILSNAQRQFAKLRGETGQEFRKVAHSSRRTATVLSIRATDEQLENTTRSLETKQAIIASTEDFIEAAAREQDFITTPAMLDAIYEDLNLRRGRRPRQEHRMDVNGQELILVKTSTWDVDRDNLKAPIPMQYGSDYDGSAIAMVGVDNEVISADAQILVSDDVANEYFTYTQPGTIDVDISSFVEGGIRQTDIVASLYIPNVNGDYVPRRRIEGWRNEFDQQFSTDPEDRNTGGDDTLFWCVAPCIAEGRSHMQVRQDCRAFLEYYSQDGNYPPNNIPPQNLPRGVVDIIYIRRFTETGAERVFLIPVYADKIPVEQFRMNPPRVNRNKGTISYEYEGEANLLTGQPSSTKEAKAQLGKDIPYKGIVARLSDWVGEVTSVFRRPNSISRTLVVNTQNGRLNTIEPGVYFPKSTLSSRLSGNENNKIAGNLYYWTRDHYSSLFYDEQGNRRPWLADEQTLPDRRLRRLAEGIPEEWQSFINDRGYRLFTTDYLDDENLIRRVASKAMDLNMYMDDLFDTGNLRFRKKDFEFLQLWGNGFKEDDILRFYSLMCPGCCPHGIWDNRLDAYDPNVGFIFDCHGDMLDDTGKRVYTLYSKPVCLNPGPDATMGNQGKVATQMYADKLMRNNRLTNAECEHLLSYSGTRRSMWNYAYLRKYREARRDENDNEIDTDRVTNRRGVKGIPLDTSSEQKFRRAQYRLGRVSSGAWFRGYRRYSRKVRQILATWSRPTFKIKTNEDDNVDIENKWGEWRKRFNAIFDATEGRPGLSDQQFKCLFYRNYLGFSDSNTQEDFELYYQNAADHMELFLREVETWVAAARTGDLTRSFIQDGLKESRYSVIMLDPVMRQQLCSLLCRYFPNEFPSERDLYDSMLQADITASNRQIAELKTIKNQKQADVLIRMYDAMYGLNEQPLPNGGLIAGSISFSELDDLERDLGRNLFKDPAERSRFAFYEQRKRRALENLCKTASDGNNRGVEVDGVAGGVIADRNDNNTKTASRIASNCAILIRLVRLLNPLIAAGAALDRAVRVRVQQAQIRLASMGFPAGLDNEAAQYVYSHVSRDFDTIVRTVSRDKEVQKVWKFLTVLSINGDDINYLKNIRSLDDVNKMMKDYEQLHGIGAIDKAFQKVAKFSAASDFMIEEQISQFFYYFAINCAHNGDVSLFDRLSDDGVLLPPRENAAQKTVLESELLKKPSSFLVQVLSSERRNPHFLNAQQALAHSRSSDMANKNVISICYSHIAKEHRVFDLINCLVGNTFVGYRTNQIGRVMNYLLPMSSLHYLAQEWVISNPQIGGRERFTADIRAQVEMNRIHTDLRAALMSDIIHMTAPQLACVLFALIMRNAFQPPEDEDKIINISEWSLFGVPVGSEWWIEDTIGPIASVAAFWWLTIHRPEDANFDIVLRGVTRYMSLSSVNTVLKTIDLAIAPETEIETTLGDPDDWEYAPDGSPDLWAMVEARSGAILTNQLTSLLLPSFVPQLMQTFQESNKSYKRIYVKNPDGSIVTNEEGEAETERVTYRDAQYRRMCRNNPVMGLLLNMLTGKNNYLAFQMPDVDIKDEAEYQAREMYSLYNDDGTMRDDADARAAEILNILNSYDADDMDSLREKGFNLDYKTKMYLSELITLSVQELKTAYYTAKENGEFLYSYCGEGDYELGVAISTEKQAAYWNEIDRLNELYYDKLWSDAMKKPITTYTQLNTRYAQDDKGNWYATSYRNGYNIWPVDTMDWRSVAAGSTNAEKAANDWATASAVTGQPMYDEAGNGMRALRVNESEYQETPDMEEILADLGLEDATDKASTTKKTTTPTTTASGGGYRSSGSRSGGGGGSKYANKVSFTTSHGKTYGSKATYTNNKRTTYYHSANYNKPNLTNNLRSKRLYDIDLDYLRPDFETKGSREAYRRSDF